MTNLEQLEKRLRELPDSYDYFVECTIASMEHHGLVDRALAMLDRHPEATTQTVLWFELSERGIAELEEPL